MRIVNVPTDLRPYNSEYIRVSSTGIIRYTDQFKTRFISEYLAGKDPTQIFKDAGFDVEKMSPKTIGKAAARFRKSYLKGYVLSDSMIREKEQKAKSKRLSESARIKEEAHIKEEYRKMVQEHGKLKTGNCGGDMS